MAEGNNGVLQPAQDDVIATPQDNGFTTYRLTLDTFTLVAKRCDYIRITNFRVRVDHVCGDGSPLSVRVVYITDTDRVSNT